MLEKERLRHFCNPESLYGSVLGVDGKALVMERLQGAFCEKRLGAAPCPVCNRPTKEELSPSAKCAAPL